MILGRQRPDRGSIWLLERVSGHLHSPRWLALAARESPSSYLQPTGRDNLEIRGRLLAFAKEKRRGSFATVGLMAVADRKARAYYSGMKQGSALHWSCSAVRNFFRWRADEWPRSRRNP